MDLSRKPEHFQTKLYWNKEEKKESNGAPSEWCSPNII